MGQRLRVPVKVLRRIYGFEGEEGRGASQSVLFPDIVRTIG
jgi:hypothetical protein